MPKRAETAYTLRLPILRAAGFRPARQDDGESAFAVEWRQAA
jgi:hypothetical protein